ncbi:acyltransferase [Flavobacterium phragmitis]|uniref:Transferase hexapeptide (Six repeat-containing protein) n=1 Tax=Flavobacterium phragmitis TaxID=739143 RepID=A0A1I1USM9_9FLAO|nr:hypothetical protein [Flavobacterium phragmitis]SFD73689.1 transferase hexapeptide (six repeat-containing protein) [Flavobacterium phragmitis]
MSRLIAMFKNIFQIQFKYLFHWSLVRINKNSNFHIAKGVKISNSKIFVTKGSSLSIGENTIIKNTHLYVNGNVTIGNNNIIDNGYMNSKLDFNIDGDFNLGNYNRIRSKIWLRFNGKLEIRDRNNINEETEIRCDENIFIGSYNQISYKCSIWDTNTHNIYNDAKRRELTDNFFPIFGYEFEKPRTKAVHIGDDCWISKDVAILKGVIINNSSVIGYRATLSNCEVLSNKVVVQKIENSFHDRE